MRASHAERHPGGRAVLPKRCCNTRKISGALAVQTNLRHGKVCQFLRPQPPQQPRAKVTLLAPSAMAAMAYNKLWFCAKWRSMPRFRCAKASLLRRESRAMMRWALQISSGLGKPAMRGLGFTRIGPYLAHVDPRRNRRRRPKEHTLFGGLRDIADFVISIRVSLLISSQ